MKNILITISFLFFTSNSFSQIVRDMAAEAINNDRKNGAYYIKDVNNYMLPYIGTWSYINGNKEFRIILTKVSMHHVVFQDYNIDYYKDGLTLEYQKYENGQLIFESPSNISPSGIIKEFGKLNMSFKDYGRYGLMFPVDLKLIPISGGAYQLNFKIDKFEQRNTYFKEHPNEPYFSVPNDIIMTKL